MKIKCTLRCTCCITCVHYFQSWLEQILDLNLKYFTELCCIIIQISKWCSHLWAIIYSPTQIVTFEKCTVLDFSYPID